MRKDAYGTVSQDIMRDPEIPSQAKCLYAYLSAFCGSVGECFPSVETITKEMGITKGTFYKHMKILSDAGIVEKCQTVEQSGKFGKVIYKVNHKKSKPYTKKQHTVTEEPCIKNQHPCTVLPYTEKRETKNNNIKHNNKKEIYKEKDGEFVPPTFEKVEAYCRERNNDIDAQNFIDFYEARGWMMGKTKMTDWKAAVRTWESRTGSSQPQGTCSTFTKGYMKTEYTPGELDKLFAN